MESAVAGDGAANLADLLAEGGVGKLAVGLVPGDESQVSPGFLRAGRAVEVARRQR